MTTTSPASTSSVPPNAPPAPNVPDTGETRVEVLRTVVRLIGEHGIDGMTMRQVARESGLSTGTINYHFTNKRGLILAALDSAPTNPTGDAEGDSPTSHLRHLLRGFILEDDERRAWWRFWVEAMAQASRDADLRERQRTRVHHQQQRVQELIAEGVRRGELRAELDASLVAGPLFALGHGLALQQLLAPDAATVLRASDALEGSLRELEAR